MTGMVINRTPDAFKDKLKEIKKNAGRNSTINV